MGRVRHTEFQTLPAKLVSLPRHANVSNMRDVESLYDSEENNTKFKERFACDLTPAETWDQVSFGNLWPE